jgi:hypothetical protein
MNGTAEASAKGWRKLFYKEEMMAYYLVRANLREELHDELAEKLAAKAFVKLRPFGESVTMGLEGARRQADGRVVWEEEDYCSPPLAMERAAVLDRYFSDIEVETVREDAGWARIADLPSVWDPNP